LRKYRETKEANKSKRNYSCTADKTKSNSQRASEPVSAMDVDIVTGPAGHIILKKGNLFSLK